MSAREERATEWPSIRLGLAGACLLVVLAFAAWAAETASTDEPSRLAQTERCFRREKLLDVRPVKPDPIAAEAGAASRSERASRTWTPFPSTLVASARRRVSRRRTARSAASCVGGWKCATPSCTSGRERRPRLSAKPSTTAPTRVFAQPRIRCTADLRRANP